MIKKYYSAAILICWFAMLLLMPVTSMPVVARLISAGTTVASPAGIFLLILMVAWFIPKLIEGGTFPLQVTPLVVFALTAVAITTASMFFLTPPYKTENSFKQSLEAMVTLGIGLSFYFLVTLWLDNLKKIEWSIRLINWSGIVILAWTAVQAISWFMFQRYPDWVRYIHELYSVGPLFRQRVSGFALEPSWFAHQLNMLYLPLWLALSINRVSVHRLHFFHITIENILLVSGFIAMFLSYSRVGLAAFLMMVGYIVIRGNLYLIEKVQRNISSSRIRQLERVNPGLITITIGLVMLAGYVGLIGGLAIILSRIDPRMAKLFYLNLNHPDALLYYANDLTFASRLVYWQAGWNVFTQYPWFGVGLGKVGFYMTQNLSAYAWRLVEVRDLVFRSDSILNIKSLWVRLLAETGIVGFSLFVSWLWGLWQTSKLIEKDDSPMMKTISWMGRFVIIGFLFEGFSVDTFALPYFWVSLGFLTAGYVITNNKLTKEGR